MEINSHPSFDRAERTFRELLKLSELPPPDEVVRQRDPDELVFIWHEPKYAVVLELEGGGAEEANAAEANGGGSGDPRQDRDEVPFLPGLCDFQVANGRLL